MDSEVQVQLACFPLEVTRACEAVAPILIILRLLVSGLLLTCEVLGR